jgi:nucleotide-binding universal stress UspA family protein
VTFCTGTVFYSYDQLPSDAAQERLNDAVAAATKAGHPIRIAPIAMSPDLGGITALWGKPREYAPFLGIELSYYCKDSLLVVMPAGLGYYHQGQSPDAAYAALDSAHIEDGIDGQADAAVETIAKLAADAGHPIVVSAKDAGSGSDRSRRDRLIILLAGVALAQPSPSDSYYVDESPADGSSTIALLLV